MKGNKGNTNSFIAKLQQIVLDNLKNEQFSVEDLAAEYGLSRSQLHKKLKKSIGKSVSQFIREVRLDEALKLLQVRDLTVSEVAYEVGFSSPTYFNTCFKDYFGYSPGEARIRNRVANMHGEEAVNISSSKGSKVRKLLLYGLAGIAIIALLYGILQIGKGVGRNQQSEIVNAVEKSNESLKKSIAVLPLKNWSGDENLEYVSDGLTDALISKIANVSSLSNVIPFTSMLAYKETEKEIKQIAKEQNVSHVLQGSFQVSGNKAKIALQLIDGTTNNQIWADEYSSNWKSTEIFSLQEMVSKNVLEALNLVITEKEAKELNLRPTDNFEAYNSFLLAEFQRLQFKKDAFDNAIPLYQRAIALDSSFVEPYGSLSQIYIYQGLIWGLENQEESWEKAKELLQTAFSLDSLNEMALAQLTNGYLYFEWNFEELAKISESETKPILSDYYIKTGLYNRALEITNESIQNNPSEGSTYGKKAEILFLMGKKEQCNKWLEKHDPLFDDGFYTRESAKWHYYLGNYEKSENKLDKLIGISEEIPPIGFWLQAVHAQLKGDLKTANEKLDILKGKFENMQSGSPAWFTALYYFHTKDSENGFEWLRKSFERREVEMVWLRAEPLLSPYREDPRYLDIYAEMGFTTPPAAKL